jgi:hypothetical protein
LIFHSFYARIKAVTVSDLVHAQHEVMPSGLPTVKPFGMLELCDGKLSRTVLRTERGRKAPDLSGASINWYKK